MRWFRSHALPLGLTAFVCANALYVVPAGSRNSLWETASWGILCLSAFVGWGAALSRVLRVRAPDLGLVATWGAALLSWFGAVLGATGSFSRTSVFALVEVGALLGCAHLFLEHERFLRCARVLRLRAMGSPPFLLLLLLVGTLLLVRYLGAASDPTKNPWDDNVAYLPFVERWLETGSFFEPFSTRRLTAYGAQTFFLAMTWVRSSSSQVQFFDHGLSLVLLVLLAAHGGRPERFRIAPLVACLWIVMLPIAAINTASYLSGAAFFLGLYRTTLWALRGVRKRRMIPLCLVSVCVVALRQNYLVFAALFLLFVCAQTLASHLRDGLWRGVATRWAFFLTLGLGIVSPWWIMAFRSTATFLYPLMLGEANPALTFQSGAMTWVDELHHVFQSAFEHELFRMAPFTILALALLPKLGKVLSSLLLSGALAFVITAHALTQMNGFHLSRYTYGPALAGVLASVLSVGFSGMKVRTFAPLLWVLGIGYGVASGRGDTARLYDGYLAHIRDRAFGDGARHALSSMRPRYREAQKTIPSGAPFLVLADDPYLLDFRRNHIVNLDMPGYTSPKPGLPSFRGADALGQYFLGQSFRYLLLTKPDASAFLYNEELWIEHVLHEESWQYSAPYMLDLLQSMRALLGRHRTLYDDGALVVLDLGAPLP